MYFHLLRIQCSSWPFSFCFNLDIDECSAYSPCVNNGICINTNGSYYCNCTVGWQGNNCEKGNKFIKISDNDNVTFLSLNNSSVWLQNCLKWFFLDINECSGLESESPCQNNGTCINNDGSFKCICLKGWEGNLCQIGLIFYVYQ